MNLRTNLLFVAIPVILALYGSAWAAQPLDQQQWTTPVPVTEVNTEYEEWAPFISFDGLSLYFSRVRTGSFYYGRIYQARRDEPSGPFTSVIEISELNESDTHILCPWVSPDNLRMYYHKEHAGRFSLAVSKRASVDDLWPKGTEIAELNVVSDQVVMPKLTADELTIFFGAYGVTSGQQEWDIWIADRADKNSPFDRGLTTFAAISSLFMDQAPSPSPDGLILYFASSRNDGNTSQLFRASRRSLIEPFVNVEHLSFFDTPGGHTYHPCISSDGSMLYFMRQSGEDRATRDIYVSYYIAAGRDYYVDAVKGQDNNDGHSPSAAFATIQKGIDSAQNGDKVTVYPGTYRENINFKGKNITLTSTDANNPDIVAKTVINGSQNGSVVTFNNGESADCVLTGFAITNGQSEYGGGIYIDGTSPTLANCTISGNSARLDGGGVYISHGNPTLTGCILSHNSGSGGGGMGSGGGKVILTNCIFRENSARLGPGGGIWSGLGDRLTLISCIFERNSASLSYGGAICGDPPSGSLTMTNCTIAQNSANDGGGIELAHRSAEIQNCFIIKNSAARNGGGIHSVSALLTLTNSVINENTSAEQGGAVYFSGGPGDAFVTNCTFLKNISAAGRTIACVQEPDMSTSMKLIRVTNSILWNGGDEIRCGDNFTITATYSDVQGGWPGEGNINADPRFAGLPEGLAAHWKFDEQQGDVAYDSVGENHGTIYGAQWTAGKNDGGLDFDGDRDYVLIGDKDSLEPQQLTLLVWAKLDDPSGLFQGGIAKGYMFGAATDYSYQLKFHDGCAEARVTYAPGGACGVACPIGDSNWHLWTMTIGQGNLSIYKDGACAGTILFSGAIDYAKSNSNFVIGARDNGMHAFDGIMDDVVLFNRVLSTEEIQQLYSGQLSSYRLLPGSPCIDAGDPAYVPQPDETDLYGNPRVMGNAIDMGAVEFQPLGLIELSVDKFEFEATVGFPNPADQILIVRNAGPGTVNWQISYDCNWLQVQPDSGRSKGEGNTAWLSVNTAGLSAGEYNCTLTVSGTPASNSPQTVQVRLIVRKNCFPDTPQYAQQYADFLEYVAHDADPSCWCASPFDGSHYQCDGDASGRKQTFTNYRVFTDDLALIIKNWKKKIDTADPCADIDHKAQLFQRYRVFTNDLGMLITNWKKRDDQLANNCPRPDGR